MMTISIIKEYYWMVILVAGAVGGLLHSIENNKFGLPSQMENSKIWDPGFVGDVLFGIAGGLVVFTILPEIKEPSEIMDYVKIVALALVGGYSGKLLLDKAAHKRLDEMENKVNKIETDQINDSNALRLIYETINSSDPNMPIDQENIKKELESASPYVISQGISMIEIARKQAVSFMLDLALRQESNLRNEESSENEYGIRIRLNYLLPLLHELINKHKERIGNIINIHSQYASLAYIYKDKFNPDWKSAYEWINKAIESTNGNVPPIYYYNILIICINLDPCPIECTKEKMSIYFDKVWDSDGRYMLLTCNEVIAPKLQQWITQNKKENIIKYLKENKGKTPCGVENKWKHLLDADGL